jgi:hypothetical protein
MKAILFTAALGLMATASAANAYEWGSSDRIDRRQERQEFRIRQGVASGELTRREYWRLEREQAYIRGLERNAEADGYVSPYERARIRAVQDAASRRIHEERHDGQRRWSRRAW